MGIDEGPGLATPNTGRSRFRVSALGLVSRTFALWSRGLVYYFVISCIVGLGLIPIEVAVLGAMYGAGGPISVSTDPLSLLPSFLVSGWDNTAVLVTVPLMLFGMIMFAIFGGAAAKLALDNYGTGNPGDAGFSVRFAFGRLWKLIGVQLLFSLVTTGVLLPANLMLAELPDDLLDPAVMSQVLALAPLLFISFAIVVYLSVRMAPLVALVVAEELSVVGAFKRTFQITKSRFWHVFGGRFMLGFAVLLIGEIIGIVLAPVVLHSAWLFNVALLIVSTMTTGPLNYVFQAVLYKDLISRIESGPEQQLW